MMEISDDKRKRLTEFNKFTKEMAKGLNGFKDIEQDFYKEIDGLRMYTRSIIETMKLMYSIDS